MTILSEKEITELHYQYADRDNLCCEQCSKAVAKAQENLLWIDIQGKSMGLRFSGNKSAECWASLKEGVK